MAKNAPPRLVALAAALQAAKRDEDAAKQKRVDAEREILSLLDFKLPEGQETYEVTTPAGSTAKVVVKQPVSTSFDGDRWPEVRKHVSAAARKAVRIEYRLDTKEARALQDDDSQHDSWLRLAALITRKPGKVQIDLKNVLVEIGEDLEEELSSAAPEDGGR
jgi:hypothetical protein